MTAVQVRRTGLAATVALRRLVLRGFTGRFVVPAPTRVVEVEHAPTEAAQSATPGRGHLLKIHAHIFLKVCSASGHAPCPDASPALLSDGESALSLIAGALVEPGPVSKFPPR